MVDPEPLLSRTLTLAAPPERIALSEWADANRVLSSEASAAPGEWRTLPFQREVLDCLSPGSQYERVVPVWASVLIREQAREDLFLARTGLQKPPAPPYAVTHPPSATCPAVLRACSSRLSGFPIGEPESWLTFFGRPRPYCSPAAIWPTAPDQKSAN
jgi:hypothetical protein